MTTHPSTAQAHALVLAAAEGYVRPGSQTHARRLHTTTARLGRSCKAAQRHGWLRLIAGGRYVLTEAGRALVPGMWEW